MIKPIGGTSRPKSAKVLQGDQDRGDSAWIGSAEITVERLTRWDSTPFRLPLRVADPG